MDDLGGKEIWEDSGRTSHPKQGQLWGHTRLLRALLDWVLEHPPRVKVALLSWAGMLPGTGLKEAFSTDAQ